MFKFFVKLLWSVAAWLVIFGDFGVGDLLGDLVVDDCLFTFGVDFFRSPR